MSSAKILYVTWGAKLYNIQSHAKWIICYKEVPVDHSQNFLISFVFFFSPKNKIQIMTQK